MSWGYENPKTGSVSLTWLYPAQAPVVATVNPSQLLAISSTSTFCLTFAPRHCVEQPAKDLSNFFTPFLVNLCLWVP